ncbi:MAG: hypothetical protein C4520_13225 [Candidatus Abyssobacteria bacterium SURF_5]|uniref:Yip1 domain-containing protein n=1 Tax=Abyssobacteria bacterium (strain SURF_5) TaxID=2093360 RepID=A0A3A4NM41_ABYX5|nr:MAG: hypothetical protein C4520_13225 [Candidatus Abyssubacteria bacterium SURF_5]
MDEKELQAQRKEIRQQIKERMQRKLDLRKREIKARIKKEKIPLHEKRRKYRREVSEEKLILMSLAKEEFRSRKRELALAQKESADKPAEPSQARLDQAVPQPPADAEFRIEHSPGFRPEEAFVYEDKEDSDAKELQMPIGEADMFPIGESPKAADEDTAAADKVLVDKEEGKSFLYHALNLMLHPIRALEEFDDYLNSPAGVVKVGLFYVMSLLPVIGFMLVGEEIVLRMPDGLLWSAIGASMFAQGDIAAVLLNILLGLLLYTSSIAIVNYFFADDANFLTLLVYFGFVEGIARILIYSLVFLAAVAGIMAAVVPQMVVVVALLFGAFFIWRACLNIFVLMSAYGYDWYSAILLALGAGYLQNILRNIIFVHVFRGLF